MAEGYKALTEKERETLRLIVRGYDAKSLARHLGISVHTVNERLRHARRKMGVSSSREAARKLLEEEGDSPNSFGHEEMGEAKAALPMRQDDSLNDEPVMRERLVWIIGGAIIMSLIIAAIAMSSLMQTGASSADNQESARDGQEASRIATNAEIAQSARQWLELVDAARWNDSWAATGEAFKEQVTSEQWSTISEGVRSPLGMVVSRVVGAQESVPAPPYGYKMIKFRTSFANKPVAVETLTLVREGTEWRVVGYWIA